MRKFYFNIIFLTTLSCSMAFFLYESIFLPQKLPTYVFYVLSLLLSFSLVIAITCLKSELSILILLVCSFFMIKEGFISALPSSLMSYYLDNYVVYQVANGIQSLSYLPPVDYYTGAALYVSRQPVAPIFSVMYSEIIGVPLPLIIKHIGSIISSTIVPFSVYLMYKLLNQFRGVKTSKFSWFCFLFSPWILFFLIWGHYSIYSISYFSILNFITIKYILEKSKITKINIIIFIIISISVILSHFYLSFMIFIIYSFFIVLSLFFSRYIKYNLKAFLTVFCIYSIILLIYILYINIVHLNSLKEFMEYVIETLQFGSPNKGLTFYFGGGIVEVPLYVRFLQWAGAISWGILAAISFIILLKKYLKSRTFLVYALFICIGMAGLFSSIPYVLLPEYGTDLFNRSIYFFGLMCISSFISLIPKYIVGKWKKFSFLMLLVLVVNFGVIMNRYEFQSWNYPINGGEDIRLHPSEWSAAGFFTSSFGEQLNTAAGLRQGVSNIGYFSRIDYYEIQPSASNQVDYVRPDDWDKLKNYWTDCCFLRKSITKYEETPGYLVEYDVFNDLINYVNIVYDCTDVFMIYYQK